MGVRVVCSKPTWLENHEYGKTELTESPVSNVKKHHRLVKGTEINSGREEEMVARSSYEDKALQVNIISPSGRGATSSMVSELESLARFDKELQFARADRAAALELLADTRLELRHARARIAALEAERREGSKPCTISKQKEGEEKPPAPPLSSPAPSSTMTPPSADTVHTSPSSRSTSNASVRRIGSARETALSQVEYRAQVAEARAEALAAQVPLLKSRLSSLETQLGLSSLIATSPSRVPPRIEIESQTTRVASSDSVSSLIARCETASLALELTCREKAAKRAEFEAAKMNRSARKTKEDLRKKESELEETREKLEDEIDSLRGKIEKFRRRERSSAVGSSPEQTMLVSRLQKPTQSSISRTENSMQRVSPRSTSHKKSRSSASSIRRSPLSDMRNMTLGFGLGGSTTSANAMLW